jgi:hypothetical protein
MRATFPGYCASTGGAVISKTVISNQKRSFDFILISLLFFTDY